FDTARPFTYETPRPVAVGRGWTVLEHLTVTQSSITPQATRAPEFRPAGRASSSLPSASPASRSRRGSPFHQLRLRGSRNLPHGVRRDWPNRDASHTD